MGKLWFKLAEPRGLLLPWFLSIQLESVEPQFAPREGQGQGDRDEGGEEREVGSSSPIHVWEPSPSRL